MALAYYESGWTGQGTDPGGGSRYKDVVVADAASGDLLVAVGICADADTAATFAVTTQAGSTGAWTVAGTKTGNNVGTVFGWAQVTSTASITVRIQMAANAVDNGVAVVRFPSGEWGGTPTIPTPVGGDDVDMLLPANTIPATSHVVAAMGDWTAGDRTGSSSYTPAGATQRANFFVGGQYSGFVATWLGQAPGSVAYGLSGVSGAKAAGGIVIVPAAGGGGDTPPPPVPISLRAAGTPSAAADAVTAINPAVPAGATTGDLSVLSVWIKPYSATVTTPAGWTKIGEHTNGTVASGVDTGSMKVAMFVRESATPGAIGAITFGSSPNSCGAVINTYAKDSRATWERTVDWLYAIGSDTANGANYSATATGNIGVRAGDWVLQSTAVNGDVGTQSAQAITGLTGATLGTYQVRQSADTTTGNDSHGEIGDAPVTAGSSTALPTFAYTNASSGSGATMFWRLRQEFKPAPRGIHASNAALLRSYTR